MEVHEEYESANEENTYVSNPVTTKKNGIEKDVTE